MVARISLLLWLCLPIVAKPAALDESEGDRLKTRMREILKAELANHEAEAKLLRETLKELEGSKNLGTEALKGKLASLETELTSIRERRTRLELERKSLADDSIKLPKIIVIQDGWGDTRPDDVQAVCRSVAQEFCRYFPNRDIEPISLRFDAKQGPMVVYGKGADGERRVLLNSKDNRWAQMSFQFAHELCHINCNYRDANKANLWFEESLCETASLFALRRMAETWKMKPPYPNWKSYAESLDEYAEQRLKETEKLKDLTFAQWYRRNEPELKKTGTNRDKNQVVAVQLLALFEKNPRRWQAVSYLNQWDPKKELSFHEYLRDWHERVPAELKKFVVEVGTMFEISVK